MNRPTQSQSLCDEEVLLLANRLNAWPNTKDCDDAAAKLRSQYVEIKRLHKVNQKLAESNVELLEALKRIEGLSMSQFFKPYDMAEEAQNIARAAIARFSAT